MTHAPRMDVIGEGLYPSAAGELFAGGCVWVQVSHPKVIANRAMVEIERSLDDGQTWERHSLVPRAERSPLRHVNVPESAMLRLRVTDFREPFQMVMEQR